MLAFEFLTQYTIFQHRVFRCYYNDENNTNGAASTYITVH